MRIQESAKNYLETISMLGKEKPYVRSTDIVSELNFSKPSASVTMKNPRESGYILMNDWGHITLTTSERTIADTMYEHHTMLSNWLIYLGVSVKTAAEDVCRIEHVLNVQTSKIIKRHITPGHELSGEV